MKSRVQLFLKYISVVIISIFLCSCGQKKNTINNNKKPDWVNIDENNCKDGYICAIGEGYSMGESSSNARTEIAKQFSVSIKSSFNNVVSNKNDKTDQFTSATVDESVNEIIEGVEITKSFFDSANNIFYSLAILDKERLANEIKDNINIVDDELKRIITKKPVNIKLALQFIGERKKMEKKYSFLTGKQIAEKVKKNDVLKAKTEPTLYKIDVVDDENFGLKDIIVSNIVENKDKIDQNATKTIVGRITMDKVYLNVEGFEKYEVNVILKCQIGNEIIGQSSVKLQETGRNKQQIIDKLKKRIFEKVNNSIVNILV